MNRPSDGSAPHTFEPFTYAEVFALTVVFATPVVGVFVLTRPYRVHLPDALAILAISVFIAVLIRPFTIRRLMAAGQLVALGSEYEEADTLPTADPKATFRTALAPGYEEAVAERQAAFARLDRERNHYLRDLFAAIAVRLAGLGAVQLVVLLLEIRPAESGISQGRAWFLAFLWALTAHSWQRVVSNYPPWWLRVLGALAVGVFLPPPLVLYLITTGAFATAEIAFQLGKS